VDLHARDGYVPTGGNGKFEVCAEDHETVVQFSDDFVLPVLAGFYLVDPVIGGNEIESFSFPAAQGLENDVRLFSPDGVWYRYNCGSNFFLLPSGGPAVTIPQLVNEAVDSLDPPNPVLAVTPHHGKHAVQMPSWLAIDPAYWDEERTESATAGRVRVTAELTPYEVEWALGNGDTLTCDNPGTVWRRGMGEHLNDCPHIYKEVSLNPPTDTWDLVGTIRFEVSHETNAPGSYGPWVPVERSTVQTIEVVEIHAVGTTNS
jgi:hypothetical protein